MTNSAFSSNPDRSALLARLFAILPKDAASETLTAFTGETVDSSALEKALMAVDWQSNRGLCEELLCEFIPVDLLVPEVYEKWRPVVRDGFGFLGARLSPERLVPKLVEQLTLARDVSVDERVLTFIRRIPALQKIGQTLARNADLAPELSRRLAVLEDGIREVDEPEIRLEIENQLGALLTRYQIELEAGLYGEGSVSALVRFTSPDVMKLGVRSGLLKVLKPFIAQYFTEDLTLLGELAKYFEINQQAYQLGKVNLRSIVENVRELYERETDFVSERESLVAANRRFASVAGIRVPRPIALLSTPTITAMTEERSIKVTDAYLHEPVRRREIARKLIECQLARPLFSVEEISVFHADPHAGNLRVDEATGDVILLDWALSGTLTSQERRSLILLFTALPLRDEGQILSAFCELSLSRGDAAQAEIKHLVEEFMDALPLASVPKQGSLGDLLNNLLRAGVRFSGSFLIFRKMLSTLEDVVEQLSPGEDIPKVVIEYAIKNGLLRRLAAKNCKSDFKIPLNSNDYFRVGLSAQSFVPRVWLQSLRSIARSSGAFRGVPKPLRSAK